MFVFFWGGALLDSDLLVVCVWSVSSLFVFIAFVFSCLCLSFLLQKHPPPPNKNNERLGFFMVFGCAILFYPRLRVGLLWGPKARKKTEQNKNTNPPKHWGRSTLLRGNHPKPSKTKPKNHQDSGRRLRVEIFPIVCAAGNERVLFFETTSFLQPQGCFWLQNLM